MCGNLNMRRGRNGVGVIHRNLQQATSLPLIAFQMFPRHNIHHPWLCLGHHHPCFLWMLRRLQGGQVPAADLLRVHAAAAGGGGGRRHPRLHIPGAGGVEYNVIVLTV